MLIALLVEFCEDLRARITDIKIMREVCVR
jgi:hypothetical protein